MFITQVATIVFDRHFSIHLFLHAVYAFVNSVRITCHISTTSFYFIVTHIYLSGFAKRYLQAHLRLVQYLTILFFLNDIFSTKIP